MDVAAEKSRWTTVRIDDLRIRYYVREPSPNRWNAVGVLYQGQAVRPCRDRCPLVIGVGTSSIDAVGDLIARACHWNDVTEDASVIAAGTSPAMADTDNVTDA